MVKVVLTFVQYVFDRLLRKAIREELNKDWRSKLEQQKSSAERELRLVSEQLKGDMATETTHRLGAVRDLEADLEVAQKNAHEGEGEIFELKQELATIQEEARRLQHQLSMELTQTEEHLAFLALNEVLS